jgi:hypothetical protein
MITTVRKRWSMCRNHPRQLYQAVGLAARLNLLQASEGYSVLHFSYIGFRGLQRIAFQLHNFAIGADLQTRQIVLLHESVDRWRPPWPCAGCRPLTQRATSSRSAHAEAVGRAASGRSNDRSQILLLSRGALTPLKPILSCPTGNTTSSLQSPAGECRFGK